MRFSKLNSVLWCLLMMILLIGAVCFHGQVSSAVITAGKRCLISVLPSLYLFSIIAAFSVKAGLLETLAQPFQRVLKTDAVLLMTVLFSQIGGYPVGAQLVHGMYQERRISEEQSRILICPCMGCGFGFLLASFGGNTATALFVWMMMSIPNLILALFLIRNIHTEPRESRQKKPFALLLTESVESAASSMLKVTSMILAFSAVMGIAEGIFSDLPVIVRSILEISNVSEYAQRGGSPALTACLLSFGGICVHLQIGAVCENHIAWGKFWLCRMVTAGMTYGLCILGGNILMSGKIPVFLYETSVTDGQDVTFRIVPGCCLLLMSVLVLKKYDFCNKILTNHKK